MVKVVAEDGHEYHKSSTANATVAPTNEATLKKAQGEHLPPDILQLVTIIDYEWNLKGDWSVDGLVKEYGYTEDEVRTYLQNPAAVGALEERGITALQIVTVTGHKPDKKVAKLTPIQLVVANKLLDLYDTRSPRKKMQDLGVSSAQYSSWMRDPEFSSYLQQRAESMLGDTQHEAMLALMDKVQAGDLNAIKYYHELTGRFTPASSREVGSNAGDLQNMVIRIIEIVIDECDPVTASRISDRLKGLVTGAQVAGVLSTPEPIVQPEIAKAREVTPEVQQLMQQGVGYDG